MLPEQYHWAPSAAPVSLLLSSFVALLRVFLCSFVVLFRRFLVCSRGGIYTSPSTSSIVIVEVLAVIVLVIVIKVLMVLVALSTLRGVTLFVPPS